MVRTRIPANSPQTVLERVAHRGRQIASIKSANPSRSKNQEQKSHFGRLDPIRVQPFDPKQSCTWHPPRPTRCQPDTNPALRRARSCQLLARPVMRSRRRGRRRLPGISPALGISAAAARPLEFSVNSRFVAAASPLPLRAPTGAASWRLDVSASAAPPSHRRAPSTGCRCGLGQPDRQGSAAHRRAPVCVHGSGFGWNFHLYAASRP